MKKNGAKKAVVLASAVAILSLVTNTYNVKAATPKAEPTGTSLGNDEKSTGTSLENHKKPNVVYVVLDDTGFADLGVYGSSINTPNFDKLVEDGILYTNYYTTPMSSPSRASMLTGFESNTVGMGVISDVDFGPTVPNIHGRVYPQYGCVAHDLNNLGYNTAAVGKWHLGPVEEFRPDGDKTNWPSSMGFDNSYVFLASQANQFSPGALMYNDEHYVPDTSDPNYHFSNDMIDKSLQFIDSDNDNSFFLYLAFGAQHGPYNVQKEYIDKYDGVFDHGWDVERELIFNRQKEMGIIPESAVLTERDEKVPAWDTLTDKEKTVYARHMQTYAGFLEHTDEQFGRLINELKKRGEYDNTIFMVVSDNGANSSGGVEGALMTHALENQQGHDVDTQYEHIDEFGNILYGTQYNKGWANVSNTPFRNYKVKAYNGGVRTLFLASWKDGIVEPNRISDEIVTVNDITPTILDILNTKRAPVQGSVKQNTDLHGTSIAKTFKNEPLNTKGKSIAYSLAQHHMYTDGNGYQIVTNEITGEWELYDMKKDPTQVNNLANEMPEKVEELFNAFEKERAGRLDSQNFMSDLLLRVKPQVMIERYGDVAKDFFNVVKNGAKPQLDETKKYLDIASAVTYKPPTGKGYDGGAVVWFEDPTSYYAQGEFVYTPDTPPLHPFVLPKEIPSKVITSKINVNSNKPEGVIFANGGLDSGYSLYVQDGKLVYEYNFLDEHQKVVSKDKLLKGKSVIKIDYDKETPDSGHVKLYVNDKLVGERDIKTMTSFTSFDAFSVGKDIGSNVSKDYEGDFPFTGGTVEEVRFNVANDMFE